MNLRITHRIGFLVVALALGALLAPVAGATIKDGRSPDTKDAAYLAHLDGRSPDTIDAAAQAHATPPVVVDGRSPDTRDAATQAHATPTFVADGRSPDTRDAAITAHTTSAPSIVVVGSGGFDWTDAGIGAAGGFAIALLLGGMFLLLHRGSRGRLAV